MMVAMKLPLAPSLYLFRNAQQTTKTTCLTGVTPLHTICKNKTRLTNTDPTDKKKRGGRWLNRPKQLISDKGWQIVASPQVWRQVRCLAYRRRPSLLMDCGIAGHDMVDNLNEARVAVERIERIVSSPLPALSDRWYDVRGRVRTLSFSHRKSLHLYSKVILSKELILVTVLCIIPFEKSIIWLGMEF